MSKRPVAVVVAVLVPVLVALTLAACTNDNASGDDGSGGSSPERVLKAPDPCALLTVPDAERAMGGPVQPPQPGGAGDVKNCVWRPVGARDPRLALSVAATTSASQKDAEKVFDQAKTQGGQPASGIGDEAYRNSPQKMTVRVANVVVVVDAGDVTDPTIAPRIESAARTAVAGL